MKEILPPEAIFSYSPGSLVVSTKKPHVVDGVVRSVLCTLIVWVGVISATHHPRVYTL